MAISVLLIITLSTRYAYPANFCSHQESLEDLEKRIELEEKLAAARAKRAEADMKVAAAAERAAAAKMTEAKAKVIAACAATGKVWEVQFSYVSRCVCTVLTQCGG